MSTQTNNHLQEAETIYRPSPEEELLLKCRAHENYYFTKNGFNRMFREKDHALAEKDAQLAKKYTQLAKKDDQFSEQHTMFAQLHSQLSKLHTLLAEQYTRLTQNNAELHRRSDLISALQIQLAQTQTTDTKAETGCDPFQAKDILRHCKARENYYRAINNLNSMLDEKADAIAEKDAQLAETDEHFSDQRTRSSQLYLQFSKLHTQLSDQYAQLAKNNIELTEQDELITALQAQLEQEHPHTHIPKPTDLFYRL